MAELVRTIILAFIQGLTEFLPVSSTAHLILPAELGAWPDQGLAFDVAVHLGTLTAVLAYFSRQLFMLAAGSCRAVIERQINPDARLTLLLVVASLPVIIIGLLFKDFIDDYLRTSAVIASTTIIFAFLLWGADKYSKGERGDFTQLGWKQAMIIGLSQVLALVPGTSRSGVTITAALFCHLDRVTAARFSFLLSIPAIAGAGLLMTLDLLQASEVDWFTLATGAFISAVVAWCTIHLFLKWINKTGFMPFVIYRILLGLTLFVLIIW